MSLHRYSSNWYQTNYYVVHVSMEISGDYEISEWMRNQHNLPSFGVLLNIGVESISLLSESWNVVGAT